MAHPAASRLTHVSRALPWVSALVLIAGIVAFAVVKLSDNGSSKTSVAPPPAASNPSTPKAASGANSKTGAGTKSSAAANAGAGTKAHAPIKFDAAAKKVAGTFILTAVQRKHLDKAWPISGPAIREDSTYKEWLTGNIAVIPYLNRLAGATFHVESRGRKTVTVQVALIPTNTKLRAQFFRMTLVQVGAGKHRHWIVDGWVPIGGVIVPSLGGAGG